MTKEELYILKKQHSEQLADYRESLYAHPQLRQLFFELTLKCNEACFHCGSSCGAARPDGLPANKYMDVLDEVKENFDISRIMLCITGGEPLLRPDFFDILAYADQIGYTWGMTSNATLITPSVARRLYETGMATISVSIDGLEKTHDSLRGLSGGYRLAMAGIENLLAERDGHKSEKGKRKPFRAVQVTTVINHENIHELDQLYRIFEDMDIDSWRVIGLEPIGRALLRPELMLTPDDQRRLFSFIYEKRSEQMPVTYGCSHFVGFDYEREVRDWYFLCNAGIYTASIMAAATLWDSTMNTKSVTGIFSAMPESTPRASWQTAMSEPALILSAPLARSRGISSRHLSRRSGKSVLKFSGSHYQACVRTAKAAAMRGIVQAEPITVLIMKITGRESA